MKLNLSGQQLEKLNKAIYDGYNVNTFEQMLKFRLGLRLDKFASVLLPFETVLFQTINRAQAEGWTSELIIQAAGYERQDTELYELAAELGVSPGLTTGKASTFLESLVSPAVGIPNLAQVLDRLARLQRQVCRIEIDGVAKGTGFLVGPDRVLTNHHVIANALTRQIDPQRIKVRFDYWHEQTLGEEPSGVTYSLAGGTIDEAIPLWSEPTVEERAGRASSDAPELTHLDYALLKVAGAPGDAAVNVVPSEASGAKGFKPQKRLWISAGDPPSEPARDAPLFILQHPEGAPLSIAWNSPGVLAVNPKKTRVTYRNNTSPGSSGSPCFNGNFQIVALHHSGNLKKSGDAESTIGNEGIPIKAVVDSLRSRNETVAFAPPPAQ